MKVGGGPCVNMCNDVGECCTVGGRKGLVEESEHGCVGWVTGCFIPCKGKVCCGCEECAELGGEGGVGCGFEVED